MSKKRKVTATKVVKPAAPATEPPQDLLDKLKVIQLVSKTTSLLANASFNVSQHQNVTQCIQFMQQLHESLVSDAASHPQADTVPALKQRKETKHV